MENENVMTDPMESEDTQQDTQKPQLSKNEQRKAEAFNSVISKMLHNKKTSGNVVQMLSSAPPEVSLPETTLSIMQHVEGMLSKRGDNPSLNIKLNGGIFTFNELNDIGNEAGLWQLSQEEAFSQYFEATAKRYIEKGLKEGTIDPVELQKEVEPLMNEEQRAEGEFIRKESGIPEVPGEDAAREMYATKRVSQERNRMQRKADSKMQQEQRMQAQQQMQNQQQQQPQSALQKLGVQ